MPFFGAEFDPPTSASPKSDSSAPTPVVASVDEEDAAAEAALRILRADEAEAGELEEEEVGGICSPFVASLGDDNVDGLEEVFDVSVSADFEDIFRPFRLITFVFFLPFVADFGAEVFVADFDLDFFFFEVEETEDADFEVEVGASDF